MRQVIAGALRRILDLICPPIAAGAKLPYGLSRAKKKAAYGPDTDVVRLYLPLCPWLGTAYRVDTDEMRHGWWMLAGLVMVQRQPAGFDVQFRVSSFPRGYGKVLNRYRQDAGAAEWLDERALYVEGITRPAGR